MRRLASRITALAVSAGLATALLASAGEASGAAPLPTITLTMTGKTITVGGTPTSGAVNIVSTVAGTSQAEPTLVYLKPGVTFHQAFFATASHHGDPNYLGPYGSLVFDTNVGRGTSTAQTVLAPGNYVALDTNGNNPAKWPVAQFTVSNNPAAAALPAAKATISAIDFGFRGPGVLHAGQLTRFQDSGFLVHMVAAVRAKNRQAASQIVTLLRAGKSHKAQRLATGFFGFAGPLSTGGLQQFALNVPTGYYVFSCFMNTQDGREHSQLGMERVIKVVK